VIWPSVYIQNGMITWWVIIVGLLFEFIVIKIFTKDKYLKSVIMVITVNAISTLVGIVAIPLSGIIGELIFMPINQIFNIGTFHISHWIFAFLLAVLCNTLIEGLALKFIFKKIFKQTFLWLFCANILSVLLCALKIIGIFG
jgi:hypothetical protein